MLFSKLPLHGGVRISYMYDLMLNAAWLFMPLIPNQDQSGCWSASLQWHMLQRRLPVHHRARTSHAKRSWSESQRKLAEESPLSRIQPWPFPAGNKEAYLKTANISPEQTIIFPNCSQPVYRPISSRLTAWHALHAWSVVSKARW